MRAMNAPIIANTQCNQPSVHNNAVLSTHICAGSIAATNPVTGACRGNLGSGLYCGNQLTGVLAFGIGCGAANNPGVYMDIRQYNDWINSQIIRTDNPQPGSFPQSK
jgi:secreted trypsin-like serine protease